MAAVELRGTIKTARSGATIAEIEWDPYRTPGLKGQEVTVSGVTAKVVDIGGRFKRGGYAYAYLYLDVPAEPAVARPTESAPWTRTFGPTAEDEDAEDRGERGAGAPGGIEVGHV